jgi:enoyl-CoA hydratase/carnithine racemase
VFDEVQLKLELLTRLALCIYQLRATPPSAIILTGRRNVFLSGADLKEFDLLTNRDIARKFIDIPMVLMEQIYNRPQGHRRRHQRLLHRRRARAGARV